MPTSPQHRPLKPSVMQREIAAQPEVFLRLIDAWSVAPWPDDLARAFGAATRMLIVGCGSSLHAGMIMRCALGQMAQLPADVVQAHQLDTLGAAALRGVDLVVIFSQSGTSTDTVSAQRWVHLHGVPTLALTNDATSPIATGARWQLTAHSGIERAIPSTKGFTSQVVLGLLIAQGASMLRRQATFGEGHTHASVLPGAWQSAARTADACAKQLQTLAVDAEAVLRTFCAGAKPIDDVATTICRKKQVIFLGHGPTAYLALEAALKMNESALVLARGFAAGELRHGPVAHLDADHIVVGLIDGAQNKDTMQAALASAHATGATCVVIGAHDAACAQAAPYATHVMSLGLCRAEPFAFCVLAALVLQQLAVTTAAHKGVAVDSPKHLTKSVIDAQG